MTTKRIQRSIGLFMAAVFTLATLAGINHLAQPGAQSEQLAHKATQTFSHHA